MKHGLNESTRKAIDLAIRTALCKAELWPPQLNGIEMDLAPSLLVKVLAAMRRVPLRAMRDAKLKRIIAIPNYENRRTIGRVENGRLWGEFDRSCATLWIEVGADRWSDSLYFHEVGHAVAGNETVFADFLRFYLGNGLRPRDRYGTGRDSNLAWLEEIADSFSEYMAGLRLPEGCQFLINRYGTVKI